MYYNARSRVRVNGQYSEECGVGVGVHQGSIISPLLFILVLEALWREFCTGVPSECLYVDDLVLMADTKEGCISKLKAWKAGMESKGFCTNMKNTKFLASGDDQYVLQNSGKYPCATCCSGVGRNSILCSQCMLWVLKTCSGIIKRLVEDPTYICPRCHDWCGRHFLLPGWYAVLWWGLWQCHCYQMLCGLATQVTDACPNHLTSLCQDMWQGVWGLRSLSWSMLAKRGTRNAADSLQWQCHDLLVLWHQRKRRNTLSFTTTETWHR